MMLAKLKRFFKNGNQFDSRKEIDMKIAIIGTGISGLTAAYALMHRRHHAYADTNRDPHSPIILEGLFSFNHRTFLEYRKIVNQFNHHQIFLKDVPRWPLLEKIGEFYSIRLLFILYFYLL